VNGGLRGLGIGLGAGLLPFFEGAFADARIAGKEGEGEENSKAALGFAREDADVGPSIPQGEASQARRLLRDRIAIDPSARTKEDASATAALGFAREDAKLGRRGRADPGPPLRQQRRKSKAPAGSPSQCSG
jgi:hypothetical protein